MPPKPKKLKKEPELDSDPSDRGGGCENGDVVGAPLDPKTSQKADEGINRSTANRSTISFPPDIEDVLAQFYRENPCFYDKSDKRYMDSGHRRYLLNEKARELADRVPEIVPEMISTWYRSNRTEYGKQLAKKQGKIKPGLGRVRFTAKQQWLLDNFEFVREHRRVKDDSIQTGMAGDSSALAECALSDSASDDGSASQTFELRGSGPRAAATGFPMSIPITKPKKKRPRPQKDSEESSLAPLAKLLSSVQEDISDIRGSYLNYLKAEAKLFTDSQWDQFKSDCNRSIARFSDERRMSSNNVQVINISPSQLNEYLLYKKEDTGNSAQGSVQYSDLSRQVNVHYDHQ